jgi:lysyl-tRNA synthetase class 2
MNDWRPRADTATLGARAAMLARIRGFFTERAVLEVETPLLSAAGNPDPGLDPFRTEGDPNAWLRTSPEFAMKRLLAAGSGDIYELGRAFRRGESGRLHNPEFTLLEWYRLAWGWRDLAQETIDLVNNCGQLFGKQWKASWHSYRELFSTHLDLDPLTCGIDELKLAAGQAGLAVAAPERLERDAWLDLLLSHVIQPALAADELLVLFDFPASQAALARIRDGQPPVAERFELLLGGVELANGYQELTDATEQAARFDADNLRRRRMGQPEVVIDQRLLAALEAGLPDCAGVALGVDRLLQACLGKADLADVLCFPQRRA